MPRVSVSNRPRGSFLENPIKEQLIRLARRLCRASIRLQQLDDMSGDAWQRLQSSCSAADVVFPRARD